MTRSRDGMFRIAVVLALLIVDSSSVLADCRPEVEAAFQKLQVRGRSYRRVTTMASTVHVGSFVKSRSLFHPIGNGGSWNTSGVKLRLK